VKINNLQHLFAFADDSEGVKEQFTVDFLCSPGFYKKDGITKVILICTATVCNNVALMCWVLFCDLSVGKLYTPMELVAVMAMRIRVITCFTATVNISSVFAWQLWLGTC
jgi:hypothetical protein